jgi:hypothetical protein
MILVAQDKAGALGEEHGKSLMRDKSFRVLLYAEDSSLLDKFIRMGEPFFPGEWVSIWRNEVSDSLLRQTDDNWRSWATSSLSALERLMHDNEPETLIRYVVARIGRQIGSNHYFVISKNNHSARANAYMFLFRWSGFNASDYAWLNDDGFDLNLALRLATAGVPIERVEPFVLANVDPQLAVDSLRSYA